MSQLTYILIPLLPFIGYLFSGLIANKFLKGQEQFGFVPTALVFASFFLSLGAFFSFHGEPQYYTIYQWMTLGTLDIHVGFRIDQLTIAMLLLVTGASSFIHLYTIGYMHGERGYFRFFGHISLFTFAMIALVMSDNFLQLFFGWEGVGLCSYLLIVHWYEKKSAQDASFKAFIQNRVGDFAFLIGIFLIFVTFGSLDYEVVFPAVQAHLHDPLLNFLGVQVDVLTMICLLLFVGAMGKSAQIFLHPWLIDAMEGPTPISALIHAATMVTAGIFMVARCHEMFSASPTAMGTVAVVGAVSALVAATMGLVATDIKRIIAFSTMSQLGYMFLACGVGAYAVGIFHLLAHGAFKALLFLGAGSVIHGLHGEQDIRKMGQLRKHFPITFPTMLIASLALAGIPPLTGFFSKDAILWQAFMASGLGQVLYGLALVTVLLTAFYSFRLVFMVFFGKDNVDHKHVHPHESPWVMTIPLIALAIPAMFLGFLASKLTNFTAYEYLGEVLGKVNEYHEHAALETSLMFVSVGVALAGIIIAFVFYFKPAEIAAKLAESFKPIYTLLLKKYYFDEMYDAMFVVPARQLSAQLADKSEAKLIDGMGVNGTARFFMGAGRLLSFLQSGYLQHYVLWLGGGLLALLAIFIGFRFY